MQQIYRFLTLIFLPLQVKQQRSQWIRAGHDPAVLYDPKTKRFEKLHGPGPALGLDDTQRYQAVTNNGLESGQVVAIGTYGIWESRNIRGEMYGRKRFNANLKRFAHLAAKAIVAAAMDDSHYFTEGALPEDDKTLVITKIQRPDAVTSLVHIDRYDESV